MGQWDGLLHIPGGWEVGLRPPAALGVEGAGTVVAVGPDVTDVVVGDSVLTHAAPLPGAAGCGPSRPWSRPRTWLDARPRSTRFWPAGFRLPG